MLNLRLALIMTAMILLTAVAQRSGESQADTTSACITCHNLSSPVIVAQWKESKHAKEGTRCEACHVAAEGSPGAREHFDGSFVVAAVSPKVCGQCHAQQEKEFTNSYHAKGAQFIGSLDNFLGEIVEGGPAANLGCKQCHGSTLKQTEDGKLDPETWPNSGIGRINFDGSAGACSSCHSRHGFSIAQAREPETCGKCHMGPDHPQLEIFNESKHGIAYRSNKEKMNLSARPWVLGKDYSAAPNCATCHMGAIPKKPSTHDVGARLSWTLRPPISAKMDKWEENRQSMQDVCLHCHSASYVENSYRQYDAAVNLYNDKFAKPAKDAMDRLYADKLITDTPFDEKIEWTYYLLWHHEGRRARHGASMMGPDYTQWHGFFEVAHRFYTEFLPELENLQPALAEEILSRPEHKWRKDGATPAEREQILLYYKDRYGN